LQITTNIFKSPYIDLQVSQLNICTYIVDKLCVLHMYMQTGKTSTFWRLWNVPRVCNADRLKLNFWSLNKKFLLLKNLSDKFHRTALFAIKHLCSGVKAVLKEYLQKTPILCCATEKFVSCDQICVVRMYNHTYFVLPDHIWCRATPNSCFVLTDL
jgi:hypothetical protein